MIKDVVIIGAGASGLLCAMEASKRGRSVIVLEHSGRIGIRSGIRRWSLQFYQYEYIT